MNDDDDEKGATVGAYGWDEPGILFKIIIGDLT